MATGSYRRPRQSDSGLHSVSCEKATKRDRRRSRPAAGNSCACGACGSGIALHHLPRGCASEHGRPLSWSTGTFSLPWLSSEHRQNEPRTTVLTSIPTDDVSPELTFGRDNCFVCTGVWRRTKALFPVLCHHATHHRGLSRLISRISSKSPRRSSMPLLFATSSSMPNAIFKRSKRISLNERMRLRLRDLLWRHANSFFMTLAFFLCSLTCASRYRKGCKNIGWLSSTGTCTSGARSVPSNSTTTITAIL